MGFIDGRAHEQERRASTAQDLGLLLSVRFVQAPDLGAQGALVWAKLRSSTFHTYKSRLFAINFKNSRELNRGAVGMKFAYQQFDFPGTDLASQQQQTWHTFCISNFRAMFSAALHLFSAGQQNQGLVGEDSCQGKGVSAET